MARRAAGTGTTGSGTTLGGRYRVGAVVSSDPRREVHDGYDVVLRRRVSLIRARGVDPGAPMPRPQSAALSPCPGVARVFDGGTWGGRLTFVTETVPAPSLADRLGRRRRYDRGALLDVGARVAGVLASLHARGVAHGALTPEHVLLTPDGPVLTEVGLGGVLTRWTGTPPAHRYRPPQRADEHAETADDVYALGRILRDAAPGRARLGADVDDLLRRMTRSDPALRPGMTAVAEALAEARGRVEVHRGPGRRPALALTAAAAGLVAASCTAAAFVGGPPPSTGAAVPPGAAAAVAPGLPVAGAAAAAARSVPARVRAEPATSVPAVPAARRHRRLPPPAVARPAGSSTDGPEDHDAAADDPAADDPAAADADRRGRRSDGDGDGSAPADREHRHGDGGGGRDGAGEDRPERSAAGHG